MIEAGEERYSRAATKGGDRVRANFLIGLALSDSSAKAVWYGKAIREGKALEAWLSAMAETEMPWLQYGKGATMMKMSEATTT
jgi:hypothetical protein